MRFYDYDGNIIEVGENMTHTALRLLDEGLSIEEVSEITYLPKERIGKTLSSPLNN